MYNDLDFYEEALKARLRLKEGGLFPNKGAEYAHVVIKHFLMEAREHVNIYCEKLNEKVYAPLYDLFMEKIKQRVSIRVLTQKDIAHIDVGSQELASQLYLQGRWMKTNSTLPHFVEVDGRMFRLETDPDKKTALVCVNATNSPEEVQAIKRMTKAFNMLWDEAKHAETSAFAAR